MSVYMNDIAAAGGIAEIRKGIRNCAKMEKEMKMRYGPKKTKYMMVKTGKEREEIVGAIALSYPPRVRVRATIKLSAAFFHDESSIIKGIYESAIAPDSTRKSKIRSSAEN